MSQYKELITALVEDVSQGELGAASKSFKTLMASKLVEGLNEHVIGVQQTISETYPDIFDQPVDVEAATEVDPQIEEYPVDSEDDPVETEQGKDNTDAHYLKGEDEAVYEQVVYEMHDQDDSYDGAAGGMRAVFGDEVPPLDEEEEEIEENAFAGAAAAAKAAGKTEFEFPEGSGKMHPVTMDDETADEINAG